MENLRQTNDLRGRVQNENAGLKPPKAALTVITRLLGEGFRGRFLCDARRHILHFGMHATI